jgi:hypothetical protein
LFANEKDFGKQYYFDILYFFQEMREEEVRENSIKASVKTKITIWAGLSKNVQYEIA